MCVYEVYGDTGSIIPNPTSVSESEMGLNASFSFIGQCCILAHISNGLGRGASRVKFNTKVYFCEIKSVDRSKY